MAPTKKPLIDRQTNAVFEAGLIRGVDMLVAAVIALATLVLCAYWLFATVPNTKTLIAGFAGMQVLLLGWIIMLIYRACYFSLTVKADINTQVEEVAKLVVAYQTGQPIPRTDKSA